MVSTHGVPLSLYRDRHGIFQRNHPHWTWPNNAPANSVHPIRPGSARTRHPTDPRLLAQAKGRIERAWRTCQDRRSANPASPRLAISLRQPGPRPLLADHNQRFADPARYLQRDFRTLPPRFDLARCLSFRTSAWSPITSSPLAPTPSPFRLAFKRGYAGDTVELSHRLMAACLSLIRRVCSCRCCCRCRCWKTPIAALPLASPAKPNKPMPASTTSAAGPLSRRDETRKKGEESRCS